MTRQRIDQTEGVLTSVSDERRAQDLKWGQQDHPLFATGRGFEVYAARAVAWKAINDAGVRAANAAGVPADRNGAWDGILLEEVFESLGEPDPVARRVELIQVAATAVAMVEALDRELAETQRDLAASPWPGVEEKAE